MKKNNILNIINLIALYGAWQYLIRLHNNLGYAADSNLPVAEVFGSELMVSLLWVFDIVFPVLIIVDVVMLIVAHKKNKKA